MIRIPTNITMLDLYPYLSRIHISVRSQLIQERQSEELFNEPLIELRIFHAISMRFIQSKAYIIYI